MIDHLSGDGSLRHMNLVKQSYENTMRDMIISEVERVTQSIKVACDQQMQDMKQSITASYEDKIAEMREQIKEMKKRYDKAIEEIKESYESVEEAHEYLEQMITKLASKKKKSRAISMDNKKWMASSLDILRDESFDDYYSLAQNRF
jgi:uncharacterized protein (DUF305 family)